MQRIALLDANVLYPAALRDVFVTLAVFDVYEPRWTALIHDEWLRNIVLNRPTQTAPVWKTRAI